MQMLMMEMANQNLRAYFVWEPMLEAVNEQAARLSTTRYSAPNSVYFWTSTKKLANDVASVIRLAAGRPAWDVYFLYNRGVTWDRVFPAPNYWQQQLDVLQGDAFNPQVMRTRVRDALK